MTGTTDTRTPGLDGLSPIEVQQRISRGEINDIPSGTSRTVGEIVRANVFTRFNMLLGFLLVVVLFVAPIQDALFGFRTGGQCIDRHRAGVESKAGT